MILGANLTKLDDYTRSLITNQTLLFIDQASSLSRPVDAAGLPAGFENARVWRATINTPGARGYAEYFAFFNLDSKPVTLQRNVEGTGPGQQQTRSPGCVHDGDRQDLKGRRRDAARAWQHGDRGSVKRRLRRGFWKARSRPAVRLFVRN